MAGLNKGEGSSSMQQGVSIKHLNQHIGEEVLIQGWLYNKRSSGKIQFLDYPRRQRPGAGSAGEKTRQSRPFGTRRVL